jgi:uncharacterized protein YycO
VDDKASEWAGERVGDAYRYDSLGDLVGDGIVY